MTAPTTPARETSFGTCIVSLPSGRDGGAEGRGSRLLVEELEILCRLRLQALPVVRVEFLDHVVLRDRLVPPVEERQGLRPPEVGLRVIILDLDRAGQGIERLLEPSRIGGEVGEADLGPGFREVLLVLRL